MNYSDCFEALYGSFDGDFAGIRQFVERCPDGPILEVGAGTGRLMNADITRELCLLEPDDAMCAHLTAKARDRGGVRVLRGWAHHIPLESASMSGAIFAFGSISEMSPLIFAVSEAARVLKENGSLYILIPNPEAYKTAALGIRRAAKMGVAGLTAVVETHPLRALGPYEYLTHASVRTPGRQYEHFIRHVYPPYLYWERLLAHSGFVIERVEGDLLGGPFSRDESLILVIQARKASMPRAHAETADSATIMRLYDELAAGYSRYTASANYGVTPWLRQRLAEISSLHPMMLDLACGDGHVGKVIRDSGVKPSVLLGLDLSRNMVSECRKSGVYDGVAQHDLSAGLPLSKGMQFDVVTAFGATDFLADCAPMLKDIRHVLAIGGELWISFEAMGTAPVIRIKRGEDYVTRYARSETAIESLFSEAGLTLIESERRLGYISPATGDEVPYFLCRGARKSL